MTTVSCGWPMWATTKGGLPAVYRRRNPVLVALILLAVAAGAASLSLGSTPMSPLVAVPAAFGFGDSGDVFVVQQLRAPRVLTAIISGALLALSGLICQTVLRNPLGSPDIIGLTSGASLSAVWAIGAGVSAYVVPLWACAGAVLTTIVFVTLAWLAENSVPRFILIGIGIQATLAAATTLAVATVPTDRLGAAQLWVAGSLHGTNYIHVQAAVLGAAILIPCALYGWRALLTLGLGDTAATTMGIRAGLTRSLLMLCAASMAAVAVSVCGPIGFVALGAPHVARLLVGSGSWQLVPTALLTGGVVLAAADVIGRVVLAPNSIPAGVVTALLGAPYLLWLLRKQNKS